MRRAPMVAVRRRNALRPAPAWPGYPDNPLSQNLDCPVEPGKGGGAVGRRVGSPNPSFWVAQRKWWVGTTHPTGLSSPRKRGPL